MLAITSRPIIPKYNFGYYRPHTAHPILMRNANGGALSDGYAASKGANMRLTGLDILLTYQCNLACDHCFVWGHPFQQGTLSLPQVIDILNQVSATGVERVFFEGGEPGLYYATLLEGVRAAKERGLWVGIVSNGYWAVSPDDGLAWLRPFAGLLDELEISRDRFHWSAEDDRLADNVQAAAGQLGVPMGVITIASPDSAATTAEQLPGGAHGVMFRGRAAVNLIGLVDHRPWQGFTTCPYEDLRDPGRVHVDPLGFLHACQGIVIGNLFETPLADILNTYDPDAHPIVGPLLAGGPAELARRYDILPEPAYADACHLCYDTRLKLRERFPTLLQPVQMYGPPGLN